MAVLLAVVLSASGAASCDTDLCHLDEVRAILEHTPRVRSKFEANEALTLAYVRFELAWAYARLGANERADELVRQAQAAIPAGDPVHAYLQRAYGWRVENAGRLGDPLPPEVDVTLNSMAPLARYNADRVRSQSTVLEGHERLDPMAAFWRASQGDGGVDPRGSALVDLRGEASDERVERTLRTVLGSEADPSVLEGALELSLRLKPTQRLNVVRLVLKQLKALPAAPRAQLLTSALSVVARPGAKVSASRLNEQELMAQRVVTDLEAAVQSLVDVQPGLVIDAANTVTAATLSLGALPGEQARLDRLGALAKEPRAGAIAARAHAALAYAFAARRDFAHASAQADEAIAGLESECPMLPVERLRLVRAIAVAASAMPADRWSMVSRVLKQWHAITDSYSTNSHVCLSVVNFTDSLMVALASGSTAN